MTTPWTLPHPPELDGPTVGAEREVLTGYLAWQRRTTLAICAGLTGEQLCRRAVPSSALTLLGIVRHLAEVEYIWFRERFGGEPGPRPWGPGRDDDFDHAEPGRAEEDLAAVREQWSACDAVLARTDLDATITIGGHAAEVLGQELSLRFVLLHVLHEYARHNGHADLLREAIDGVTGR